MKVVLVAESGADIPKEIAEELKDSKDEWFYYCGF